MCGGCVGTPKCHPGAVPPSPHSTDLEGLKHPPAHGFHGAQSQEAEAGVGGEAKGGRDGGQARGGPEEGGLFFSGG